VVAFHRATHQWHRYHEHHARHRHRAHPEIGIRKAIGAAHREILYQFLIEAFLISGGGAVIGILIGLAIPVLVQPLLPGNLRVPISTASVLIAFVVSCSTGLFFGYLPANNAARLQPIESLRTSNVGCGGLAAALED